MTDLKKLLSSLSGIGKEATDHAMKAAQSLTEDKQEMVLDIFKDINKAVQNNKISGITKATNKLKDLTKIIDDELYNNEQ